MKKLNFFWIVGLIAFLCLTCLPNALAVEPTRDSYSLKVAETNIIDVNLAAFAAADYLPAFYPGNWEFFHHLVCYDLDGLPAAYVIIFRDPNSSIKTWEEVTEQVKKASDELDELDRQIAIIQASQKTPQEEKDKLIKERKAQKIGTLRKSYLSGDFATVVTGATDQSQLFIRCYRGLPEIIVKEPDLQKELGKKYPDTEFELGLILYFGPSDLRYEAKQKSPKETTESEMQQGQSRFEESYAISVKEKTLISIKDRKEELGKIATEKEKQLSTLATEARNMLEEAEIKGKQENISKWAEYEQIYIEELKNQQGGEGEK